MCLLVNVGDGEGEESGGGQAVQRCISGQTHVQRVNVVQACLVMTTGQASFSGDWKTWLIAEDRGDDGVGSSFIGVWDMHTLAEKSRNHQLVR